MNDDDRLTRAKLVAIVEGSEDAILTKNLNGIVTSWNAAAGRLFGYAADEAIGQPLAAMIVPPERREEAEADLERLLPGQSPAGYETVRIAKDGRRLDVRLTILPLRGSAGQIVEVCNFIRDITEQKLAQERLHRAQLEWEWTFNSVPDLIAVLDRENRVRRINRAMAERLERSPEECVGQFCYQCIHGLRDPPGYCPHTLCVQDGRSHTTEVHEPQLKGHFLASSTPLRDEEGRLIGSVHVARDISARKQVEEALQKAKEELARVNQDLERKVEERTAKLREMVGELEHFSYTITHDMRAPLRAMQSFAHLLLEEERSNALDDSVKAHLGRIKDSAARMDALITDALQYSQTLRGDFPLKPVDVAALLRSMLESYPNLQPPQAEIRVEDNFPLVLGNEAGLTQCLSNLLANAVKFVPAGKTPQVRVWAEPRGDFVRLWIEDNGIGIPKEYQNRIWEMFQRLGKSHEGTGIGLALARKVVSRMGGRVGVESQPGVGSRFWLELKEAVGG